MKEPQRIEFEFHNGIIGDVYWYEYAVALEQYLKYLKSTNVLFHKDGLICIGKCEVCDGPTHGENLCLVCADLPGIDSDLPF